MNLLYFIDIFSLEGYFTWLRMEKNVFTKSILLILLSYRFFSLNTGSFEGTCLTIADVYIFYFLHFVDVFLFTSCSLVFPIIVCCCIYTVLALHERTCILACVSDMLQRVELNIAYTTTPFPEVFTSGFITVSNHNSR